MRSKVKSQSSVTNQKKDDSSMTVSDQEKAEVLNDYFASVLTRDNQDEMPSTCMQVKEFDKPLDNITISAELVEKVLKGLNPGKSMGPDEINPLLLKTMSKVFSVPLARIFQESVNSGEIPTVWKDARVTALLKKGQNLIQAVIALSLTSVVCKCLETIIRVQMIILMNVFIALKGSHF